jgi:hypothetical protein
MKRLQTNNIFLSLFTVFAFTFLLTSCEKEVHINLGSEPARPVVQGAIETDLPPYVLLTSTLSFFSNIDLKTLENSFLHGADIKVTDGIKTATLKEYAIDTGASSKFYVYTVDTSNLANVILGQDGHTYTLTITYNGNTYTSVTKIPQPKGPDSVWFARPSFIRDQTPDSAMQLFASYTDPDTTGNYVRYFTQRDNQQFWPSGIFSDEIINGKTVDNIGLIGGYENTGNDNTNRDSLIYFFPGETVTLKWCEIDKGVYDFWNTMQFAQNAVGNPFSSPINVKTNITNGAVGIWAGYGSVKYTRVVPH